MEQTGNNGMAVAGFILALFTFFFGWIPILGWITWILGIIFSAIGIGKAKRLNGKGRGLAIAGLIISFIGIILMLVLGGMIMAALGIAGAGL